MRESVLLALIHIFAIVSTVNPGGISSRGKKILRSYLRRYLNRELEEEYFSLFENNLEFYSNELKAINKDELADDESLISFQITNICRQIKKGLFLDERMIVFLQLLEFTFEDGTITEQENNIIDIVARTFNISGKEYSNACAFMIGRNYDSVSPENMLVIESDNPKYSVENDYINYSKWKHLKVKGFRGQLFVLFIESTGSLILTYDGSLSLYFKGRDIIACRPYLLDRGVNIKGPGIDPIYYTRVYKAFIADDYGSRIIFEGNNIEFSFKNSDNGIKPMNFRLESGNLVGIMGGSGVGKTTLINLLHGKIRPDKGSITINGFDLNEEAEKLRGIIGYVPQDDMLLEELTVFENLYFSARLCFGDYSDRQICELADKMLADLDLTGIRDLQVGDLLNKKVSGGQRKRLNIGLELMRGPAVLFVDEPTSGLSSHDSSNVMNLLRKHALSGKLVICNIHQPSSDILKLFDRLWLLDKGGFMVYDGDPVEALVYFKTETSQANATESECPNCGNIDTDNILQILEVKVINNEGFPGKDRQVKPAEWYEKYRKKMMPQLTGKTEKGSLPVSNFKVPGRAYQIRTFIKRNITRKIADTQFIVLNLFEAPVLAFVLGFLSKYSVGHSYTFSDNKSYPVFLFIAVVVALFLGLMVSAEEIFKDRKILNREKFLNISRFSYLVSKTTVLFSVSALQTLFFVVVSNWVLEVKGMFWQHWVILFTTSCYGNLIGLNISSGMKSVVSIYILIPLILVPQLLLGGAMIKFDDLHRAITKKEYVPLLGDMMATRWAYEALMVEGFRNNLYNKATFDFQAEIEQNNYYKDDLIKNLKNKAVNFILQKKNDPADKELIDRRAGILKYHLADLSNITGIKYGKWIDHVNPNDFDDHVADSVNVFLNKAASWFIAENRFWYRMKNEAESRLLERLGEKTLKKLPTAFNNTKLEDIVKNQASLMEPSYFESSEKWIQKSMPIFMRPTSKYGRAHFYAPYKQIGNMKVPTIWFNIAAIWIMTILLAFALYYDLLKKFIEWLASITEPFTKQFGRANA